MTIAATNQWLYDVAPAVLGPHADERSVKTGGGRIPSGTRFTERLRQGPVPLIVVVAAAWFGAFVP